VHPAIRPVYRNTFLTNRVSPPLSWEGYHSLQVQPLQVQATAKGVGSWETAIWESVMLRPDVMRFLGGFGSRNAGRVLSSPLMDLAAKLKTVFPTADIRVGNRGLTVCRQNRTGYPVSVELLDDGLIVAFGPGLMEFDDVRAALSYVVMACSGDARLRVVRNGAKTKRWKLEIIDRHGNWRRAFAGGFSLHGGSRTVHRDEEVILQNRRQLPSRAAPAYELLAS